jgi:ribosomal protein S18 acetylase RimI-like enzyme
MSSQRRVNPVEVTIRQAIEEDYAAVNRILQEGQDEHADALPGIFAKARDVMPKTFFRSLLHNGQWCVYVAEANRQMVGLAMIEMKQSPNFRALVTRRYAHLHEIAVLSFHRRHGIGRRLFEQCAAWAQTHEASSMELTVWNFNESAIEFYRSLGMQSINTKMSLSF